MNPTLRRRPARMLLLLGGVIALAACSAFTLAWNFADDAVIARVEKWVELTPEQRTRLEARLQPWLQTIARERFPDYAAFLRTIDQRSRDGFDAEDTRWAYAEARARYERLLADALVWIAPTLDELTDEQHRALMERMHERNDEYRSDYLTAHPNERTRPIAERLIEQVERWTGPLDVHQHQLVHKGIAELPDTFTSWLRYRMRMQARLLAALHRDAPPAEIEHILRTWWIERSAQRPERRAAQKRFERHLVEVIGELTSTFTARQRASMSRRLRALAEDLEAIHNNAQAS